MLIFAIVVLGVCGLGNFYILKRFFGFFEIETGLIFWILLILLSSSLVVSLMLDTVLQNTLTWVLHYLAAFWFGIWFLLIFFLLLTEPLRFFGSPPGFITGALVLTVVGGLTLYSFWNARQLEIRVLEFSAPVEADLVQLSDLHFGSPNGMDFNRVIDAVRKIEPDIVLITGDLIESSTRLGDDRLKQLGRLGCPVFLSLGNHERYAGAGKLEQLLSGTGITVLRNEAVLLNGIQIIALDDSENHGRVEQGLRNIEVNGRFSILMYHRPDGFKAAARAGIDLMLSGHTHSGQIWPFNWLVRLRFPRLTGLFESGRHRLYVTTGTGNWGPPMRLGSRCEVVHIKLRRLTEFSSQ